MASRLVISRFGVDGVIVWRSGGAYASTYAAASATQEKSSIECDSKGRSRRGSAVGPGRGLCDIPALKNRPGQGACAASDPDKAAGRHSLGLFSDKLMQDFPVCAREGESLELLACEPSTLRRGPGVQYVGVQGL